MDNLFEETHPDLAVVEDRRVRYQIWWESLRGYAVRCGVMCCEVRCGVLHTPSDPNCKALTGTYVQNRRH